MHKALDGVRVLDLSRVVSGPFCGAVLADMGAEVIKVEGPGSAFDQSRLDDDVTTVNGVSILFASLNRGKKGITLNLKSPKGKKLFKQLVKKSDVLIQNFRPGVMDRLGLSYQELSNLNKRLIYVSITGFGSGSPYADFPAYDNITQAMSGLMSATGFPEGPPTKVATYISDYSAGLYAALAICSGLVARSTHDTGQHIEISMLDSTYSLLGVPLYMYLASGIAPPKMGNSDPSVYPMDLYQAKDGYFALAAFDPNNFSRLCNVIGRQDLIPAEDSNSFSIQNEMRDEIKVVIDKWAANYKLSEVLEILTSSGVPAGPVLDIEQISKSEHIAAREMLVDIVDPQAGLLTIPAFPIKMSQTPLNISASAPGIGEHNFQVFRDLLNLDDDEIHQLKNEDVI